MTRLLRHARVELALHTLRDAAGPRLLVLHELGGSAPPGLPEELAVWPGGVWALDFTGHGQSTVPRGGGYYAEILMADADFALRDIGAATLVGYGVGAYTALLLAGARPREVRGAILCDGRGLAGGGPDPGPTDFVLPHGADSGPPDPFALVELSSDMRPPDYAVEFAEHVCTHSDLEQPITVAGEERPPWLAAILELDGVGAGGLDAALESYARAFGR